MKQHHAAVGPTRAEVDAIAGPAVLEFGTPWCGHCRAAQPLLASAIAGYPGLRHIQVEDASGQPLGRSFGVKLWPTLVFLHDGVEVSRLVRPRDPVVLRQAIARIHAATGGDVPR